MEKHPQKVLILSTAYAPLVGGSELAIQHLTDRMSDIHFDLITGRLRPDLPEQEQIGNVRVFRVGGYWGKCWFILPKFFLPLAIFRKARSLLASGQRYDLIHAFQASQAAGAGWILKKFYPDIPLIVTLQEGKDLAHQPFLTRFFRRLILQSADSVTVISGYLRNFVMHLEPDVHVTVIPNGVDTEKFTRLPDGQEVESEKLKVGGQHTVISVSRLVPKNGLEDLIRAMPFVQERFPDAKLVLIGDGPLREKLQAVSYKLQAHVEFTGFVPYERLPAYLGAADIFVRPSLSEGLGSAFLEAMAAGVPVVASSVGGIPDFLTDGQTGLFCAPGDPQDIAEKVLKLLNEPDLARQLTQNASRVIRERFTWEIVTQQMRSLYNKILSTKYEIRSTKE